MSLINFGAGLSAAGSAVSNFAEKAGVEQQKADLEKQQILLADQLKGGPQDREAKSLALIPQRLSIDTYLKATGHPGGLADFGSAATDGGSSSDGSAAPAPAAAVHSAPSEDAPARPVPKSGNNDTPGPASGSGGGAPADSAAFPKGAPVVTPIGDKGKILGIPLPPGWTPTQAAIAGPEALAKAWESFSKPSDVRPGASLTYYDFATGTQKTLFQQPNTPAGYLYDPDTKSYVQIGHGLESVAASKKAEAAGTSQGELPAKEQFAGFQKGLDVGTELVDSYDPVTQTTTKVTKADALKTIRTGGTVTAPPVAGEPSGSGSTPIGLQKDGSYKTPEGTTIPAPPKIDGTKAGFQAAPSEAQKATQSTYAETVKGWEESVLPAAQSEQRFLAMADALKKIQSGAWTSNKVFIARNLIAAGMDTETADKLMKTDPAQAEIMLKNNFSAALTTLGASKLGRITQNEIFAQQKNLSNPDLQPEANLAIIAEGIGIARFQQKLADDWNTASKIGYNDPLTYQQAWIKANPIQKFVNNAQKEVGALKGMKGAPAPGAYTWTPQGLVPNQ